ncbi:MAG: hypothetical protein AYP45_05345 [Candidatus Brocadia carolinensis]|uniref:Uncharacterized protein n=1 Tax=Candidatus Brocadia carolinensis TaxID=1004156 RepID=A0A1V4AVH6_9BACT|nr:MAG: hypothetical protein AYP45_05345 [Candidatus Brocadia caroliniensis]
MITQNEKSTSYDLVNFTIRDMTKCGKILRNIGKGANNMEDVANRIVHYLYNNLIDGESGNRASSLIRFFKTHTYEKLDDELQNFSRKMLGDYSVLPGMKCLTLLATAGENPEWNFRKISKGHKAIPLPSEQSVHQIPMIRTLILQLGLSISMVVKPDPKLLLDTEQNTYNVFHVSEAPGSPYIPAQKEFVIPYGIKSVLGFGGILPSGDVIAVIMFLKVPVSKEIANYFKILSLNIKIAVLPFENSVFA